MNPFDSNCSDEDYLNFVNELIYQEAIFSEKIPEIAVMSYDLKEVQKDIDIMVQTSNHRCVALYRIRHLLNKKIRSKQNAN